MQDHLEISHFYDDKTNQMVCFSSDVQKAMIEFAQMHVEAALRKAAKEVKVYEQVGWRSLDASETRSLYSAYPRTNIK